MTCCNITTGTRNFMAPEVYRAGRTYGGYAIPADIFSFGLCLLEMYTQILPYDECANDYEVQQKIQNVTSVKIYVR